MPEVETQQKAAAWAKEVNVDGRKIAEIELPVSAARNFGITFMAAPDLTVTLVDDKGAAVGTNKAGTTESRMWFRSIFVDKPVNAGTWKIRVDNTSDRPLKGVFTIRFDVAR